MKTATFPNGFTRTYKGDRAVTVAWIIADKDGNVLNSGFSMDREKAQKTAEGNCTRHATELGVDMPDFHLPRRASEGGPDYRKYLVRSVRAAGLAEDIERGKLVTIPDRTPVKIVTRKPPEPTNVPVDQLEEVFGGASPLADHSAVAIDFMQSQIPPRDLLRAQLAGAAMQGMVAGGAGLVITTEQFAERSVKLADALLKELEL